MLNQSISFPSVLPEGYAYLDEPVEFDPVVHLALEFPKERVLLQDLGYGANDIAACPTDFAVASKARLLSKEGAAVMLSVARSLREYATGCERIENMVRGGVYQSQFLKDLCLCPAVTEFMSDVFGVAVAPHTMPLHLGHMNFSPDDLDRAVDKWHHDTLALDYVMMVSDPNTLSGGEFQYFLGTKTEAAEFKARGEEIPDDRVVSPEFPGAGYIVPLQGNMVVHRGAKLNAVGERISMVNGYVPLDANVVDPCRFGDLKLVDPHHVLFAEWARHKAWLSQGKLGQLIENLPFTDDRVALVAALRAAVADVEVAIADLEDESDPTMIHYGG